MPSYPESSTGSPINGLPYDILREVFIRCLPPYPLNCPLKDRQPNTKIAPMLLCQVCSSWRMVALTSATLWSHLPYCFTIKEIGALKLAFSENEIEFIRWWKKNQGAIPPFLRLDANFWWPKMDQPNLQLTADAMGFVLEYLTSAQYLELDTAYWDLIREGIEAGYQFVCPNLHTLVYSGWADNPESVQSYFFYDAQALIGLVPNRITPSTLLHLAIHDDVLPNTDIIPNHWSTLTHISLCNIRIPLAFWFSLLRAVPALQWGYFDVYQVIDITPNTRPTHWTLPQLSTLYVNIHDIDDDDVTIPFPLSLLFTNLHLPAVHMLSLFSFAESWSDHRAITEIYAVLQSTPAVTVLSLRGSFLSLQQPRYHSTQILPLIRDNNSIWTCATHLVHLQFKLPYTSNLTTSKSEEENEQDLYVQNAFFRDSGWLGLNTPTCPIRKITLIDTMPSYPRFSKRKQTRNFTMSSIQKHVEKAPNVTFQIKSDSIYQTASELWKKWGSKF